MRPPRIGACSLVALAALSFAASAHAAAGLPGRLAQLPGIPGCVSNDGTGGLCGDGVALDNPADMGISPDGANAYVVAGGASDAISIFRRDAVLASDAAHRHERLHQRDGQHDAVRQRVGDPGRGGRGRQPRRRERLRRRPAADDSVAVFDRDPVTGALTQKLGDGGVRLASRAMVACA